MLETLLLLNFLGLGISARKKMGAANPFKIYFAVWSAVFFGYYLSSESFAPISSEFILLIVSASSFALLILMLVYFSIGSKTNNAIQIENFFRNRSLLAAQLACLVSIPFAYQKANELSGGVDIFTVLGYIYLRSAMTEDGQGFGFLTYFSILSYVLTSIFAYKYSIDRSKIIRLFLSVSASIFYAYINTARTGILLLILLIVFPLLIKGRIGRKGIFVSTSVVLFAFVLIATMTAKGISVESSFYENVVSLTENLRSYTVAPFLAFSFLEKGLESYSFGANTFRFFLSIANSLGVYSSQPLSTLKEYVYVPDPTNVYTVYETYFRDFSYIGVLIPPSFLILHWWLYKKSVKIGGRWVFLYSASIYPLAMQFFADQYFSLLSVWFQLIFWYWIFLSPRVQGAEVNTQSTEAFA